MCTYEEDTDTCQNLFCVGNYLSFLLSLFVRSFATSKILFSIYEDSEKETSQRDEVTSGAPVGDHGIHAMRGMPRDLRLLNTKIPPCAKQD